MTRDKTNISRNMCARKKDPRSPFTTYYELFSKFIFNQKLNKVDDHHDDYDIFIISLLKLFLNGIICVTNIKNARALSLGPPFF